MDFQYIAVDWQRQNILLSADSMAGLNRLILSEKGQLVIQQQAVWIYRIEEQVLVQVQQEIKRTGVPFNQLVQPDH
ncbi:hypothetical protein [Weissella halotolerans]|uniref:Uncharacterized protein n=1 Tax=Weissella halotolerans DSM 20190 TaxID=1123500 RepID=A0A0R2FZY9_9LACO|nr:hypothetical protein [Weissella halotolerans]KRN33534.1 hypothetical protein IV68_GL000340 [Weissella halotolerans DSM 20190]